MMRVSRPILSVYRLLLVYFTNCCSSAWSLAQNKTDPVKCMADMLNQCPPHSSCDDGSCVCLSQFERNPEYNLNNESSDFCIIRETILEASVNKSITFGKVFREDPEPHHILGGILIPICIVLVILTTIFLSKKLQLLQTIRQVLLSSRPRRPAYEDVILVGYEQ